MIPNVLPQLHSRVVKIQYKSHFNVFTQSLHVKLALRTPVTESSCLLYMETAAYLCFLAAPRGRGRGRGRGRRQPMAAADDLPVVGLEANVTVKSPNKPGPSASTETTRPGRVKSSSQDAPLTVGEEPKLPDTLKLDVLSSAAAPPKEQRTVGAERRIVEATDENIVVSINNNDTDAVASPASVAQKPLKIGSGRLGKIEVGSGRKPRGKRDRGQATRTTAAEEPVTIGIAVIRTPSDQPTVHYRAVDPTPKLKGILKQTARERCEDWVEESVETLDWDKELEEAQRRKAQKSRDELEGNAAAVENLSAGKVVKEADAVKPSAMSDDDEDEWEDVEDDEGSNEDVHDISAESFDKFIKEHTLKLDVELAAPDITEWTVRDPSGSITAGSQDSFLKTPVGQTRVVDWGAEMDQLSQTEKHKMSTGLGQYYTATFHLVIGLS